MLNQNMIILVIIFEKNEIHKLKDPFTVSFSKLVVKETFKKKLCTNLTVILIERKPLRPSDCSSLHVYKLLNRGFFLTERQTSAIISEAYL